MRKTKTINPMKKTSYKTDQNNFLSKIIMIVNVVFQREITNVKSWEIYKRKKKHVISFAKTYSNSYPYCTNAVQNFE